MHAQEAGKEIAPARTLRSTGQVQWVCRWAPNPFALLGWQHAAAAGAGAAAAAGPKRQAAASQISAGSAAPVAPAAVAVLRLAAHDFDAAGQPVISGGRAPLDGGHTHNHITRDGARVALDAGARFACAWEKTTAGGVIAEASKQGGSTCGVRARLQAGDESGRADDEQAGGRLDTERLLLLPPVPSAKQQKNSPKLLTAWCMSGTDLSAHLANFVHERALTVRSHCITVCQSAG